MPFGDPGRAEREPLPPCRSRCSSRCGRTSRKCSSRPEHNAPGPLDKLEMHSAEDLLLDPGNKKTNKLDPEGSGRRKTQEMPGETPRTRPRDPEPGSAWRLPAFWVPEVVLSFWGLPPGAPEFLETIRTTLPPTNKQPYCGRHVCTHTHIYVYIYTHVCVYMYTDRVCKWCI